MRLKNRERLRNWVVDTMFGELVPIEEQIGDFITPK
jgi:hypothetical protein